MTSIQLAGILENHIKYPDFIKRHLYGSVLHWSPSCPLEQQETTGYVIWVICGDIICPFVISLNRHVCLQSPKAVFDVLVWEGHSHAVVPQTLRAGSSEFPAFVSTRVECVSMQAFVC